MRLRCDLRDARARGGDLAHQQLGAQLQELGIASLIAYAAWSDLVLTPVQSTPEAMESFDLASHPADLVNYGERAWCRLETYISFARFAAAPDHIILEYILV